MTPGLLKTNKGGRVRARPRPPDDPSIRVVLAEGFRRELGRERRARVASKVLSPGRSVLHPSSVSRYLRGRVSPTLLVARRLAAAAGRPLAEAVVAYSRPYGRSTERWAKEMFYARPFRGRVFAFLEMFNNVLGYVHFGFPTDRERSWRRAVRPSHDRAEYAYFEIAIEGPLDQAVPFDFILAYQLFEHPAVFIDYGEITITMAKAANCPPYQGGPRGVEAPFDLPLPPSLVRKGNPASAGAPMARRPSDDDENKVPSPARLPSVGEGQGEGGRAAGILETEVHGQPVEGCVSDPPTDSTVEVSGFELWTRRSHTERVSPGVSHFWVQTWIDGKATDFVVRSSRPFTLGPMLSAEKLPAGPLVIIPFHPGGMHRYGQAGA
jgi:hypothetical protein